jgi:flagellar protein FlbD
MILLHRLGRDAAPLHLNADLVLSVEANPDTVVHLTTGANLVVRETPDEVVGAIRSWRRSIQPLLATSAGDSP